MIARKLALVTGASGGLGFELAKLLAAEGYDLALVARSEVKLLEIAEQLRTQYRIEAQVVAADLACVDAADAVFARVPRCDVLVNNAGFATNAPFVSIDEERITEEILLDVLTLTRLTRKYLSQMIARRDGKILNVASTAGFLPGPFMAVYYAAKAYVISFSQALASELRGSGVTVSCFCPGAMVGTGFATRAHTGDTLLFRVLPRSNPVKMAKAAYRGLARGKLMIVPGTMGWLADVGSRVTPRPILLWISRKTIERGSETR